ncbi:MAG: MoxR family ATPase [Pseudomonadales bacterium]|nr:MoxR family ATPase [Pseudomonadales bacterium]
MTEPLPLISTTHSRVAALLDWLHTRVIGQQELMHRLVVAVLTKGHLLVQGAPGLAKTRAIKELARAISGEFHRIQFTPDLLPSDVTGTDIYRPEDGSFSFQKGPIFHNLVLADEVNRAPAKVQSALLEGMGEHQVTVGRRTYALPSLFMVMATQNPIEQEGTYPLPEAQLDRFLMLVKVDYPTREVESSILRIARMDETGDLGKPPVVLTPTEIEVAQREVTEVYMSDAIEEYIVALVTQSRDGSEDIEYGASPRATIALDQCSRANAWLDGRDFVSPEDVESVLHDVLRHRLILTFEAEARGVAVEELIDTIATRVPVP